MYRKIALRNVRRQLGNYLIYFITVALTVALMFAVNNIIYNEQLQQRASTIAELKVGLIILSIFVGIIVAFVLGYANAFMLRLRKREFGTYLTLGMNRKNIVTIFFIENILMGLFALIVGLIGGSVLYQGLLLLTTKLLDIPFEFTLFSLSGVILTVAMVGVIFLFSVGTSSFYLNRVTIYDLIHGEKKVQKDVKYPLVSLIIAIISLALIIGSFLYFSNELDKLFNDSSNGSVGILMSLVLLAVTVITFTIGFARSIMYVLLKSKRFSHKEANRFLLRQLSQMLNNNAVLLGVLSFLLLFSMIAANFGFLYKTIEEASLDKQYPFDIIGNINHQADTPISIEKAKEIIEDYVAIESFHSYEAFTNESTYFHQFTPWHGEGYSGFLDTYMKQSEFNEILKALGEKPLQLKDQFAIYSDTPIINADIFSDTVIESNGKTYHLGSFESTFPVFIWANFIVVVPDEVVEGMKLQETGYAIDLANTPFDAEQLADALSYTQQAEEGNYLIERSDFRVKEQRRIENSAFSAIFIVGSLYMSVVFIFLAMAILALKVLSTLTDDRKKYELLYRLGATRALQIKTLAKQIFSFFFLPVCIPLLSAIPIALILNQFVELAGFSEQINETYIVSYSIVGAIFLIYLLYYFVTFLIAKRTIVE